MQSVRQLTKRTGDAAAIMLCHTFLGGVTVSCMLGLQWLLETLGHGREILLYDKWPIEYLFQTIDIAIVLVVGAFGLWETIEVFRKKRSR